MIDVNNIYKENRKVIFNLVLKNSGNKSDAADVLQEGVIALWQNSKKEDFVKIVKNRTGILLQDDQLVQGYYEKSLTDKLKERLPKSVGFVHIDVDLYSSTVTVLDFIKKFLVSGTVILFDDWYCFPPGKEMGERRAFNEFLMKYPEIEVEEWKNYSTFGKSFLVRKV